jgi:hypothetical protein
MRWKISPRGHDPRTIDLLAIIALVTFVVGSGLFLASRFATPPATTAFIVPSQSVHW